MARWVSTTLLVLGILMLGTAYWVQAAPGGQSAEEGEALFRQYCAGCHTIGGGDLSGPDLLGVAERRDPEWLEHWLAEPDRMMADGDPIALRTAGASTTTCPCPTSTCRCLEIDALLTYMGVAEAAHPAAQQQVRPGRPCGGWQRPVHRRAGIRQRRDSLHRLPRYGGAGCARWRPARPGSDPGSAAVRRRGRADGRAGDHRVSLDGADVPESPARAAGAGRSDGVPGPDRWGGRTGPRAAPRGTVPAGVRRDGRVPRGTIYLAPAASAGGTAFVRPALRLCDDGGEDYGLDS